MDGAWPGWVLRSRGGGEKCSCPRGRTDRLDVECEEKSQTTQISSPAWRTGVAFHGAGNGERSRSGEESEGLGFDLLSLRQEYGGMRRQAPEGPRAECHCDLA